MDKLQEIDAFSNVESALLEITVNMGRSFLNRKIDRPPHEVLITEIKEMGYSAVGRKYGVSDNAVRKWMKDYKKQLS
jgi:hypothetical protein